MTRLKQLVSVIKNKRVFIQTHNFPDPDAIASAYGLKCLLKGYGIEGIICYKGKIDRMSLRKMLELLEIEIYEISELKDLTEEDEVILVDAQKGNMNIVDMTGEEIACIDHHPIYEKVEYRFTDIREKTGACASIIAEYFMENGIELDKRVATALMYGIRIDTANMTRGVGQIDLDVFYWLYNQCDMEIIKQLDSCNLQFDDLNAYANAIQSIQVYGVVSFANTGCDCPEPLVASISDFMLALSAVEFSVVYSMRADGIKLSVRSNRFAWDAGRITMRALEGFGNGGGHATMAGGFVPYGEYRDKTELLIDKIQEQYIQEISKLENNV